MATKLTAAQIAKNDQQQIIRSTTNFKGPFGGDAWNNYARANPQEAAIASAAINNYQATGKISTPAPSPTPTPTPAPAPTTVKGIPYYPNGSGGYTVPQEYWAVAQAAGVPVARGGAVNAGTLSMLANATYDPSKVTPANGNTVTGTSSSGTNSTPNAANGASGGGTPTPTPTPSSGTGSSTTPVPTPTATDSTSSGLDASIQAMIDAMQAKNDAANAEQQRQLDLYKSRDTNLSKLSSLYGPGYEKTAIGDTFDDDLISQIVQEQYDNAMKPLQMNRQRGALNDVGFTAATDALNKQKQAAISRANTLGGSVLQGYRDSIGGIYNDATSKIGMMSAPGDFDFTGVQSGIDAIINNARGSLEGDIRSTLGGENFFDTGALINTGGQAQGAINTRRPNWDTLTSYSRKNLNNRGLGTTGVF